MTTIVCVMQTNGFAIGGDGQVTQGERYIAKNDAVKVFKETINNTPYLFGFAGEVVSAQSIYRIIANGIQNTQGSLSEKLKSIVASNEKEIRNLNTQLIVADGKEMFTVSGDGGIYKANELGSSKFASIGSGSPYALSYAKALIQQSEKHNFNSPLSAEEIVSLALEEANQSDPFTNGNKTILKGEE